MKKSLLVLLSVIVLVIFFGPVKLKANDEVFEKVYCEATIEDEFIDNQILVVVGKEKSLNYYDFKNSDFIEVGCINIEDLTASRKEEVLARVNGEENNINLDTFRRILLLTLNKNDKQNVLDCIKKLEKRDDIKGAEPNYIIENESVDATNYSNNNYYSVNNDGTITQWATSKIKLEEAWEAEPEIFNNNNERLLYSVNVAVIDTGIAAFANGCDDHPGHTELIYNVDQNNGAYYNSPSEYVCNNCYYKKEYLYAEKPHGTFVAGIIGAADDEMGIRGVSKTVNIISYKINLDTIHNYYILEITRSKIIQAIEHISSNFAYISIINCSFGAETYSLSEYTAISNYNGLVICSAGNDNVNTDENPHYPASYSLDNIISVGNSDINDLRSNTSNYGVTSVDLFAPGEQIVSTIPYNIPSTINKTGYDVYSGTSFSAPYVAGVAAMIWSRYPELTWQEVKHRILANVDKVSTLDGLCLTGGRLNAYNAYVNLHSTHQYDYINEDANYHIAQCINCYYNYYETHSWIFMPTRGIGNLPGLQVCSKCGANKIGNI